MKPTKVWEIEAIGNGDEIERLGVIATYSYEEMRDM